MSNRSQTKTTSKSFWFLLKGKKQRRPLKRILTKLRSIHKRYIDRLHEDKDCAYWYTERPHVGLLATAVWLAGGVALEEYGTHKIKKRKRTRGRADLYFKIAGANFYCEAKHCTVTIGPRTQLQKIDECLNRQPIDAGCKFDHVLALCFATVRIGKSKTANQLSKWISRMQESLEEADEHTVAVWIGAKYEEYKEFPGKKYMYPGFFFVMREYSPSTRAKRQSHSMA
jgi:hypothetical protein